MLHEVNLSVERGTVHGLLGTNGSGKSTIIGVLAGIVQGDSDGSLQIGSGPSYPLSRWNSGLAARSNLKFVHQDLSLFEAMTVAENLSIPANFDLRPAHIISPKRTRVRARQILEEFAIEASPDDLVGQLEPIKRTMVAIARALQSTEDSGPGVLVLDEPTASLPDSEAARFIERLREYAALGYAIVYVSHRLDEVMAVTDAVTVIRDGRVIFAADTAAVTKDSLIQQITGPSSTSGAVTAAQSSSRERVRLRVDGLSSPELRSVSFEVRESEVVGVAGLPDSGHRALLETLFGLHRYSAGAITLDGESFRPKDPASAMKNGVALIPGDRERLGSFGECSVEYNLTVGDYSKYSSWGMLLPWREHREVRRLISEFNIAARSGEQPMRTLSGGNRQKAVLARWLARNPRLILLDEPTQGVDVGARAQIHQMVLSAARRDGASVVVQTSDMEELAMIADRVLIMAHGEVVDEVDKAAMSPSSLVAAIYQDKELV